MNSTPDELVAATRDLALAALHEITPASTVGPFADHRVEDDGSVSLRFRNRLSGYPGWFWTVTVAQVDDAEPTVLTRAPGAHAHPSDPAPADDPWAPAPAGDPSTSGAIRGRHAEPTASTPLPASFDTPVDGPATPPDPSPVIV